MVFSLERSREDSREYFSHGINKVDLLEKEKIYRENEGEGDDYSDRSDISDSSDGEESQSECNDVESDSESDQERITQQESSKP